MTTYYVANAGSDSNNGTSPSTPFQTLAKFQSVYVNGDIGLVNRGDIFTDVVAFSNANGLTLDAYGSGALPKFAPPSHTLNPLQGDVLTFLNCDNITLQNWELIGSTTTYTTVFVRVIVFNFTDGNLHNNFTIQNCSIHDALGGCIFINQPNTQSLVANNIKFLNNTTFNFTTREGFALAGPGSSNPLVIAPYYWQNITVTDSTFNDVTGIPQTSTYGLTFENAKDVISKRNSIARIGLNQTGPYTGPTSPPFGIEILNVLNAEISNNEIDTIYSQYSPSTTNGGNGIAIDWTSSNINLDSNHIKNCWGSGISILTSFGGNRVSNNILNNNCTHVTANGTLGVLYGVIDSANGSQCDIINNDIINTSRQPCFSLQNTTQGTGVNLPSTGINVLNNKFSSPVGVACVSLSSTGLTLDGNSYQSGNGTILNNILTPTLTTYTALAAWQTAVSGEVSGISTGNCNLVQTQPPPSSIAGCTAYAPIPGSPLLNAGSDMFGTYGVPPQNDFFGTAWMQNSIGAIYNSGLPTVYAAVIYANNPLAWWRFGETTGASFSDSIGTFVDGIFSSCALNQTTLVPGDGSPSVSFNGTSSSAIVPAPAHTYALSAFTIVAWITPTVVNLASGNTIIESQTSTPGTTNFTLFLGNATLICLFRDTSNVAIEASFGFTFVAGTTYDILVTWTGGTITCCINGASQTPTYIVPNVLSSITLSTIQIGVDSTPGFTRRFFNGKVSNVSLFSSVLSSAQALAIHNAGIVISYNALGPASGSINVASTNFTVTPTSSLTDTVTITSSHGGDTITPSTLSWSSSAISQTFTVTGSSLGSRNITLVASSGDVITGSPLAFNVTIPFTVSAPALVYAGQPATITYTPLSTASDTVTPNDNGAGGIFAPATLTFTNSSAPQTVQYSPPLNGNGPITLSGSSSQGALFTPATTICYAVMVDGCLIKSGKWFRLSINSAGIKSNGNWLQAMILSVPGTPTFKVNNNIVQIGPIAVDTTTNFVAYLAECGGVQNISMVNAGLSKYTNPTFTASGGGGTGIVFANSGVGTSATGILSYTITNPGSGYTTSFTTYIPAILGQSPSVQAAAYVTVTNNVVTSVMPATGGRLSNGTGFTPTTATGIVLPGSGAYAFVSIGGTFQWGNSPVPGTGLTVTAKIDNYIIPPLVTSKGTGFVSPPIITITDPGGSGTGATCVPVMTGPLSSDTVTFSVPVSWAIVECNGVINLLTPPITNGSVANSVGVLEGPVGHTQGFTSTPTMGGGGNIGRDPISIFRPSYFTGKNKLKAASGWQPGFGTTGQQMVLDANHYMYSWTPHSWVSSDFYSFTGQSAIAPQGHWAFQYDDDYYGGGLNGATIPACFLPITVPGFGASFTSVAGPFTIAPVAGAVTIVGGAITAIGLGTPGTGLQAVQVEISGSGNNAAAVGIVSGGSVTGYTVVCGGQNWSGTPTVRVTAVAQVSGVVTLIYNASYTPNVGANLWLRLQMVSGVDGLCHAHNPWAFCPNNTIDRSKPYATDDVVVSNLTSNGMGPGVIRFMDVLGGPFTPQIVDASDFLVPTNYSWLNYPTFGVPAPEPPNSPTFSGTTTAGSPVITGISPSTSTLGLLATQQIYGNGIPGIIFVLPSTFAGAHIVSIDSSTQITISANATFSGVQTLSINPYPAGNALFRHARRYSTDPTDPNGLGWSSPNVYSSQNFATDGPDSFGPYKNVTTGPLGNADNGNFITGGFQGVNGGVYELRSDLPHGLKTGQVPNNGVFTTSDVTFTGNTTTGTNTITNCNPTFTFNVGTIIHGPGIPPSPYTTITNISGTTITISANATATKTAAALTAIQALVFNHGGIFPVTSNTLGLGFLNSPYWVTGPNTVAFWTYGLPGSGGNTDFILSTSEIPVYLNLTAIVPEQELPYEYCAAMCGTWPNTALHLNVPWSSSDACLQSIAQRIQPFLGPGNEVLVEMGNEPWNIGPNFLEVKYELAMQNSLKYYSPGTQRYPHFTPTGSTSSYVTTGTNNVTLSNDQINVLMAANKHYVIKNAFAAAGGNPDNVKLLYGGDYGSSFFTAGKVAFIKAYNLPQDYIAIAPYQATTNAASFLRACYPAGYAGNANWGNWPVDAMNDFTRHYLFFSTTQQSVYSQHFDAMSGTSLRLMAYEGGVITLLSGPPFTNQVQQDAFYHSSFADVAYCWYAALQNGDPAVANSGLVYASYFSLYLNAASGQLWKLADGSSQVASLGLNNKFITPQGGTPGDGNIWGYYQSNDAPGLYGLKEWIGETTPPVLIFSSDFGIGLESQEVHGILTTYDHDSGSGSESQLIQGVLTTYDSDSGFASEVQFIIISSGTDLGSGLESQFSTGSQSSPYFIGPTSGAVGQSLIFTISLNSSYRGSVTPVDSSGMGTFVPSILYWNNSSQVQTFIYIPNSPGTRIISLISNPFLSILDSVIVLTVIQENAESIILTGPPLTEFVGAVSIQIGVSSANFTVTPNGLYTGIITPTDINVTLFQLNSGIFNPPSITFNNSSTPQTFTYTATAMGYKPISISANPQVSVSAPVIVYVNPPQ